MKLLVACDAHIFKTNDGKYWCGAIYDYKFWTRYLGVFDSVRVAARVKLVSDVEKKWKRVDGENVEIYELPFFQGPAQLAKSFFDIRKKSRDAYNTCDAALFRFPSPTAQMVWYNPDRKKVPTALEIVYNLIDDLHSPTASLKSKVIGRIQAGQLKSACRVANGVSYVTEYTIQKHFPCQARIQGESKKYFESFYSTITMSDSAFSGPRTFANQKTFTLVLSDVAMNGYRKGEKTLLAATKMLRDKGYDVRATIIGDGSKRVEFEALAEHLGIKDYVLFTGLLSSSDQVREYLKQSDIFVFPTKGEGLPRGILEAMAMGLPVVSAPVGGIPEVLSKEFLAESTDVEAYANIIENLIQDSSRMEKASKDNFEKVQQFNNAVLQARRDEFYGKLKALAENQISQ